MRPDSHAWLTRIESRLDALLDGGGGVCLGVKAYALNQLYSAGMKFGIQGNDIITGNYSVCVRKSSSDDSKYIVVIDYGMPGEDHTFLKCKSSTEVCAFLTAVGKGPNFTGTLTRGPGDDTYTITATVRFTIGSMSLPFMTEAYRFTVGSTRYQNASDL